MDNYFHKVLNTNKMIGRRRQLRSSSTNCEKIFWEAVRNNKIGHKFKRQYSIRSFVVDFYCAHSRLAIEIDGGIHLKTSKYDKFRTDFLNSLGIKELRFKNSEILKDLANVLNVVKTYLPSPEIRRGN